MSCVHSFQGLFQGLAETSINGEALSDYICAMLSVLRGCCYMRNIWCLQMFICGRVGNWLFDLL